MTSAEIFASTELGLIYGIAALGIYLSFRILNFPDLTCDGSFACGALVCAHSISLGLSPSIALLLAFVAGGMAGLCTSFLHYRLGISDLLSGILVGFALYSINLRITGGTPNISLLDAVTVFFQSTGNLTSLATLLLIAASVWLAISYALTTNFGLGLKALGANPILAQSMGVQSLPTATIALFISNALVALSAGLAAQYQGFADIGQGQGTLVSGLAAVILGERMMKVGPATYRQVAACFIGSCVYRLFLSVALHSDHLGLITTDLNLVTTLLIIAVLYFSRFKRSYVRN